VAVLELESEVKEGEREVELMKGTYAGLFSRGGLALIAVASGAS